MAFLPKDARRVTVLADFPSSCHGERVFSLSNAFCWLAAYITTCILYTPCHNASCHISNPCINVRRRTFCDILYTENENES